MLDDILDAFENGSLDEETAKSSLKTYLEGADDSELDGLVSSGRIQRETARAIKLRRMVDAPDFSYKGTSAPAPDYKSKNFFKESLENVTASLFSDIPEMGARVIREFDPEGGLDVVRDAATKVIDWAENNGYGDMMPSSQTQDSYLRRSWMGFLRSAPTSAAAMIPGVVAGIPGGLAGVVGGAALSGGTVFGINQYSEFTDDLNEMNRNLPPEERLPKDMIHSQALKAAFLEGGLEAASNVLTLMAGAAGRSFSQPLKQTINQALRPSLKQIAKAGVKAGIAEVPVEMSQEGGEAYLRREVGLAAMEPLEAAKEAIGPALLMGLFFGSGTASFNAHNKNKLRTALSDPAIDQELRNRAVEMVSRSLESDGNLEFAAYFEHNARKAVNAGEAVEIDEATNDVDAAATGVEIIRDKIAQLKADGQPVLAAALEEKYKKISHKIKAGEDVEEDLAEGLTADTIDMIPAEESGLAHPQRKYGKKVEGKWYSRLEEKIAANQQKKIPISQIRGIVKTGIDKEELEWTGFNDYIDELEASGQKSIPKDELVQWVRDNAVEVREEVLGDRDAQLDDKAMELYGKEYKDLAQGEQDRVRSYGTDTLNQPRWTNMTLSGGTNHREIVVYTPKAEPMVESRGHMGDVGETRGKIYTTKDIKEVFKTKETRGGGWEVVDSQGNQIAYSSSSKFIAQEDAMYELNRREEKTQGGRAVGYIRVNDRTGPNGEKILHIDNLQSPRHQRGAKSGYEGKGVKIEGPHTKTDEFLDEIGVGAVDRSVELRTPDAPFKGDRWVDLLMRRAIQQAVKGGYDAVTWTTGQQQNDRWGVTPQMDYILVDKNGKKVSGITGFASRGQAEKYNTKSQTGLPDGEAIVKKVKSGYGLIDIYDSKIPKSAKRVTKKMGGRVGKTRVNVDPKRVKSFEVWATDKLGDTFSLVDIMGTEQEAKLDDEYDAYVEEWSKAVEVHSLPITPEMKKAVKERGLQIMAEKPKSRVSKRAERARDTNLEETLNLMIKRNRNNPVQKMLTSIANSNTKYSELARELLNSMDNKALKVKVVSGRNNEAHYDLAKDKITIDPNRPIATAEDIVHEALHAATSIKLDSELKPSDNLTGEAYLSELKGLKNRPGVSKEVKNIVDLYLEAIEASGVNKSQIKPNSGESVSSKKGTHYGFASIHEFVSESFVDSEFQLMLNELKGKGQSKSILQRFIDVVKSIMGLDVKHDSILAEVIMASEKVISKERPSKRATGVKAGKKLVTKPIPRLKGESAINLLGETKNFQELVRQIVMGSDRLRRVMVGEARARYSKWKRAVGEKGLEDIGAYTEGIENINIKGDTAAAAKKRVESDPNLMRIYKEITNWNEKMRQDVNKIYKSAGEEEFIDYLSNYLMHKYVGKGDDKIIKQRIADLGRGKLGFPLKSPQEMERKFESLAEAISKGLTPLTQNAGLLHMMWADTNYRVAINKELVRMLRDTARDENDNPVIMPKGKAPADWVVMDHPALNHALKKKKGDLPIVAVHPDIAPILKAMLQKPFGNEFVKGLNKVSAVLKKSALSISLFHHWALAESSIAALSRWNQPLRGVLVFGEEARQALDNLDKGEVGRVFDLLRPIMKYMGVVPTYAAGMSLMNNPAIVFDQTMMGMMAEKSEDVHISLIDNMLGELEARFRNKAISGPIKYVRKANAWWDKKLWDQYHTGLKAYAYNYLVSEAIDDANMKNIDPMDPQIIKMKQNIAAGVNDMFGGQDWVSKAWATPQMRQILQMVMLAPDWTYTSANIARKGVIAFTPEAIAQRLQKKGGKYNPYHDVDKAKTPYQKKILANYWVNMILFYGLFGTALNIMLTGKPPWENEKDKWDEIDITDVWNKWIPWADPKHDKSRRYMHTGKQFREVISWARNPLKVLGSKASPVVQEAIIQWTGTDPGGIGFDAPWQRENMGYLNSLTARITHMMNRFVPFSVRGENFAFAFPVSKGMTRWKAMRAYEDLLKVEIGANKTDAAVKYLRNMTPFDTKRLKKKLDEAAKANGLNPKAVYGLALTKLRSRYYSKMWDHLQYKESSPIAKIHQAKADNIARMLVELGAKSKNIAISGRKRGTPEDEIRRALKSLQRARKKRASK